MKKGTEKTHNKILVVNAGSSSLKYQFRDMENESLICKGLVERIGMGNARLFHKVGEKEYEDIKYIANHKEAFQEIMNVLLDKELGVICDVNEINAIGHRVLHTGEDFTGSVVIDEEVIKTLKRNIPLGPLHMPANILCIESCREILPEVPMVAVFDTAFHMTMPKYAYMYAIRYEDYEEFKVRKYGFHGTSHKYVSQKAIRKLNQEHSRIITCHLGNGSSIAAVVDGKCIDTSMGLTPLEGLIMGTRSGDIDPACLEFLMEKKKYDIHEMLEYLNKESGFKGIYGKSDSRDIVTGMRNGEERAKLAFDMSCYRIKKYIGSYTAAMGGVDAIVFTGGIGENSSLTRAAVIKGLEYLGIDFDYEHNDNCCKEKDEELTKDNSKVKVYVIPTNEELVIARETEALIK